MGSEMDWVEWNRPSPVVRLMPDWPTALTVNGPDSVAPDSPIRNQLLSEFGNFLSPGTPEVFQHIPPAVVTGLAGHCSPSCLSWGNE
jgi:hypothetical protein